LFVYHLLLELIKKYNLDGIDIDIEEEVDISVPLRSIKTLYRDMGPEFLITMLPLASALSEKLGQNLSKFSYFELVELATAPGADKTLVSRYNAIFYGDFAEGPPLYHSVVDAGWGPERFVMTVLDCANDGQSNGLVHIAFLQQTIKDVRAVYPRFGGIAGWEYCDPGTSDSDKMKLWAWVKVGQALFGTLPESGTEEL
jgi:hypothetical protein